MIEPFRGWRLNLYLESGKETLCLPYDCGDEKLFNKLRKVEHNAIHLEVPKSGPKSAKAVWKKWIKEGALEKGGETYYILYETWKQSGAVESRIGVLGLLDLKDVIGRNKKKSVWPHERTKAPKVALRTRHLIKLGVHISPIFLIADDSHGYFAGNLHDVIRRKSRSMEVRKHNASLFDGVERTVYTTENKEIIKQLDRAIKSSRGFLVADGHHRFEAAKAVALKRKSGKILCYVTSSKFLPQRIAAHPESPSGKNIQTDSKIMLKDVIDVAKRGEFMPPKSTYFWPKVPCGIVYTEI
ncbi:DUF1015 family protein [Elusimicrobiota bacterium]